MSKKDRELLRMVSTQEGVSLADPDVERIEFEFHTPKGEIQPYQIEFSQKLVVKDHVYVPLYLKSAEDKRRLERILIFEPDAGFVANSDMPNVGFSKPREEIVQDEVWQEYKAQQTAAYAKVGAAAAGLTIGAFITVYKWRHRQPR